MKSRINNIKQQQYVNLLSLTMPIIIGSFLGITILVQLSIKNPDVKLDEFALGDTTTVNLGQVDNVQIHCHDFTDFSKCYEGYKDFDAKSIVLWLGNSQVHAINQMKPDDETAAPILHRNIRKFGYYFLTFSQPNANLQEHYLLFEYLRNRFPVDALVLPVVFDDMRETGVRPTLREAFSDAGLLKGINSTSIGRELISKFGKKDSAGNDMAAIEDTLQEKTESLLNNKLSEHSFVWAKRSALRGSISLFLYKLRNWIFGINPSTTRKMIPGRYKKNLEAFETILDVAHGEDIDVLVYIVPIRNDVKIPYDADEYQNFKNEIQSISTKYDSHFVNLEDLIPGELWGTKQSTSLEGGQEYDFMHFKAEGHRLLAEALNEELMTVLDLVRFKK